VTGSNGKTIVKEWIYQILQHFYSVIRSPRSYNSQLGVPLSLWQLREGYEFAVIEAGISELSEMERLAAIVAPEIGILTNIGNAHGENFASDKGKLFEKLKLFEHSETLIYRGDQLVGSKGSRMDACIEEWKMQLEKPEALRTLSWVMEGEGDFVFTRRKGEDDECMVDLRYHGKPCTFKLPFADEASVENSLHVIALMVDLDLSYAAIQEYILKLEPVEMRLEILNGVFNSTLVNDVYNSDLAGLEVALDVLKQQNKHEDFTVILSDVFQSGMKTKALYAEVAKLITNKGIQHFVGIGKSVSKQAEQFPEGSQFFRNTDEFMQQFNRSMVSNRAVLIKGARNFYFEKITQFLQARYHKTVLEVHVNKLLHNLNYYRSLLRDETKVMVMVKALSYGSGGHEVAHLLQHENVDYLAVAFADEGMALRRAGVHLPIMVMNSDLKDFRQMIEMQLEPEIYSMSVLRDFLKACRFMGVSHYPVHLKIDTGMHRLGFGLEELGALVEYLVKGEIKVASVFTHLAGAYDPALDAFSKEQIAAYQSVVGELEQALGYPFIKHVLNTSGIERLNEHQMDMVRLGIGLYGYGEAEELEAVSVFKTQISQIRALEAGETVGYGREGEVKQASRIATIPVGYADGIDRRLGNGNYSFFLNGSKVATIGNICMDMCMLDISGVSAREGDTVELIGEQCRLEEMAEVLGTISYEVLTGIPERVKRVYVRY
jgi:alanine racemase